MASTCDPSSGSNLWEGDATCCNYFKEYLCVEFSSCYNQTSVINMFWCDSVFGSLRGSGKRVKVHVHNDTYTGRRGRKQESGWVGQLQYVQAMETGSVERPVSALVGVLESPASSSSGPQWCSCAVHDGGMDGTGYQGPMLHTHTPHIYILHTHSRRFSILSAASSTLVPSKLSATSLNDFRLLAEAVGKVDINCVWDPQGSQQRLQLFPRLLSYTARAVHENLPGQSREHTRYRFLDTVSISNSVRSAAPLMTSPRTIGWSEVAESRWAYERHCRVAESVSNCLRWAHCFRQAAKTAD